MRLQPLRGHFEMPITLNGHNLEVLVDTGAFNTTLTPEAVDEAHGLYVGGFETLRVGGLGGLTRTAVAQFNDVQVAGGSTHDKRVFVMADQTRQNDGAYGSLGGDLLSSWDVDFDAAASRMKLYQPRACAAVGPDWSAEGRVSWSYTKGGGIHIPIELDGRSFDAVLDTGAPVSLIEAGRLDDAGSAERQVVVTGIDQRKLTGRVHHVGQMIIAGHAFGPTQVLAAPMRLPDDIDMILGLDFLRHHRLFIAYQAGLLFLGPKT